MHIVERLGGARMPCRGGCRLCVHGETGLLLPPVPRGTCSPFLWCAGGLWAATAPLVCVYLWRGKSCRAPGAEVRAAAVGSGSGEGVKEETGVEVGMDNVIARLKC